MFKKILSLYVERQSFINDLMALGYDENRAKKISSGLDSFFKACGCSENDKKQTRRTIVNIICRGHMSINEYRVLIECCPLLLDFEIQGYAAEFLICIQKGYGGQTNE